MDIKIYNERLQLAYYLSMLGLGSVEVVKRFSGSNEVDPVPQMDRFLVFTLWIPFHKQLTLWRNAQARHKVIYILPEDLVRLQKI